MDKLRDYTELIKHIKDKQDEILKVINKIKDKSYSNTFILRNKEVIKLKKSNIAIYLWKQDGLYYEGLQYSIPNNVGFYDGFWIYSDIYDFYEKYIDDKDLEFKIHKLRYYGEPKLSKPKELKGIKQFCTIEYIHKKCKCSCFILGNDVWIQHRDYFSPSQPVKPEESGLPLKQLCLKYDVERCIKGFIYPDAWGDIVLRNEAWLVIKNLVHHVKVGDYTDRSISDQITRQQEKAMNWKKFELEDSHMNSFWEKLVTETKKYINEVKEE